MNSNNLQGLFSKRAENKIKIFTAQNQPISDLKKFINQITMSEIHDPKPISPKIWKQPKFLLNNKQLVKKKTLMDLLPNWDISKLMMPTQDVIKSPIKNMSTNIFTSNFTNLTKNDIDPVRMHSSNILERRKSHTINSDQPFKVSTTPTKSKNAIHNLDVKKNLNDYSVINEKQGIKKLIQI